MRPRRSALPALGALGALLLAPAAHAAVAPGRVAYPVSRTPTRHSVDPFAVGTIAVLPGGGLVTAGIDGGRHLVLTRLSAGGALDPGFGRAGIATLTVPAEPTFVGPFPTRILPLADGRLLVTSAGPASGRRETGRLVLSRVTADGHLDRTFGTGGSRVTALQTSATAALQPDGKIVVTGATGTFGPPTRTGAPTGTRAWAATRLNPDGTTDAGFGASGTTALPGTDAADCSVLADGRIAVVGIRGGTAGATALLVVLRPDGTIDPGFSGGRPLALAGQAPGGLVPRVDGAVDVLTQSYTGGAAQVQRLRADGTPDPAFGAGGAVAVPTGDLGAALVPGIGGQDIAVATPSPVGGNFLSRVRVTRLQPDGTPDPAWGAASGTLLEPAFGGGYATVGAVQRLPSVGPLRQNGFSAAGVRVRPDGGLLVAGTAAVIQYTGEGEGRLHEEAAVAAYGPALAPDLAWGGPQTPATLRLTLPAQHARTDALVASRRAIRVDVVASGAGLARVEVRARGHVIARANAPVSGAAPQRLLVSLTADGRRIVPRARDLRVTVRARLRDLLTGEATATASGILR